MVWTSPRFTVYPYELPEEAKAYLAGLKDGDPVVFIGSISPNSNVFTRDDDPVTACDAVVQDRDNDYIALRFPAVEAADEGIVCRAVDGVRTNGWVFRRIALPGVKHGPIAKRQIDGSVVDVDPEL